MKISGFITVALIAGVLFVSCKQETGNITSGVSPQVAGSPANTPKPEIYLFAVNVENLRMREQPDLSSGQLGQLKEGEIIEGTGEKSATEQEIELRGIPVKAPFCRVNVPDGGQAGAWVFGGALTPVYAGPRSGLPDQKQLTTLTGFLKTLNVKSLESGEKAWGFVERQFQQSNAALADAVFILLEQFLRRMETEGTFYTLTDRITWSDQEMEAIYQGTYDPNKNPVAKSLVANGFRIVTAEGSVFPVVDWRKLQSFFAPKVTPAMKAYIDQQTAEQNKPMYDDGGVIIPLEEVADQAIFWEKFNQANPFFLLREETKHSEEWLHLLLVNGSDNTPVFNYENDELIGDFKKMWGYVLQKYPETKAARRIKQMADLCAAEKWKRTKKVEAFQARLEEEFSSGN